MRRGLKPEDLGDLLGRPLVAVLATHGPDGSVLLSPVWHEWHEGGFSLFSPGDDVKVRHLRHDPRASVLVFESELPYRAIEVRGLARLTSEGVAEAAVRIATRYLGSVRGPAYVAGGSDDVLIRVEPGDVRAWDFSDEFEPGPER